MMVSEDSPVRVIDSFVEKTLKGKISLKYSERPVMGRPWGYPKILSFIGKQSFWIMALHFTGFKIGSVVLNLFINTDVSSLTPTASNAFIVAFYLFAGILIPCVVGLLIDKCKRLTFIKYKFIKVKP